LIVMKSPWPERGSALDVTPIQGAIRQAFRLIGLIVMKSPWPERGSALDVTPIQGAIRQAFRLIGCDSK
ncbi:MAG: hypothetical protein COZ10_04420, partial [Comamonadaceae bacterium CG_4_10_14_3_um_filter_60_75]